MIIIYHLLVGGNKVRKKFSGNILCTSEVKSIKIKLHLHRPRKWHSKKRPSNEIYWAAPRKQSLSQSSYKRYDRYLKTTHLPTEPILDERLINASFPRIIGTSSWSKHFISRQQHHARLIRLQIKQPSTSLKVKNVLPQVSRKRPQQQSA